MHIYIYTTIQIYQIYTPIIEHIEHYHTAVIFITCLHHIIQAEMPLGPVADDVQHHHGFLHRLDVPSSGLILMAKTYSAYYDLQAAHVMVTRPFSYRL